MGLRLGADYENFKEQIIEIIARIDQPSSIALDVYEREADQIIKDIDSIFKGRLYMGRSINYLDRIYIVLKAIYPTGFSKYKLAMMSYYILKLIEEGNDSIRDQLYR